MFLIKENNRVQIFDEQLNYVDKVDLINKKINDPGLCSIKKWQ